MADLKLNQIIALEKGAKDPGEDALTRAYQDLKKAGPMSGIARTYRPKDDDGDQLPAESTKLQMRVKDLLRAATGPAGRLLDLTATKDAGNQVATADIVVDGVVVLSRVPVTTLLTLEKKLVAFANVVGNIPTLDPSEEWVWDDATNSYRTVATETIKTKKVPRVQVLYDATDKHPAQVQPYMEDVLVGRWSTIKYSGAIPETERADLAARVAKLRAAVQVAREEANLTVVPDYKIGDKIFEYLGW